jgi:hypothetical protein
MQCNGERAQPSCAVVMSGHMFSLHVSVAIVVGISVVWNYTTMSNIMEIRKGMR